MGARPRKPSGPAVITAQTGRTQDCTPTKHAKPSQTPCKVRSTAPSTASLASPFGRDVWRGLGIERDPRRLRRGLECQRGIEDDVTFAAICSPRRLCLGLHNCYSDYV